MGASASSVWYNLRVPHPMREVPIIDYDLALLFQPVLMLGITVGVALSVIFPYWLITVLIIILFLGSFLELTSLLPCCVFHNDLLSFSCKCNNLIIHQETVDIFFGRLCD